MSCAIEQSCFVFSDETIQAQSNKLHTAISGLRVK
jgi:hypothetical protein